MTQQEMRNEIFVNGKLQKIDSVALDSMSKRYSIDLEEVKKLYKETKDAIKAELAEAKLKAFEEKNCLFTYKNQKIAFKPVYMMKDNSRVILWRTNLDKNGIYYIYENASGSIVIDGIACVSERSKSYEYRTDLVISNKSKVKAMLSEMLNNCQFGAFWEKAKLFTGFKEVEEKGALKGIKLENPKDNRRHLVTFYM